MDLRNLVTLALALSLLLPPAARAAPEASPAPVAPAPAAAPGQAPAPPAAEAGAADGDAPPPGTPADQKLWRDANEASLRVITERTQANRLQWRLRQAELDVRLHALAGKTDAPDARRAGEVLQRLRATAADNYLLLTRPWPVDPTRGCRYQVLNLEGVMHSAEHPRRAAQLRGAREEVEECLEKAQAAIAVMARSSAALLEICAEAEALLPPQVPARADPPPAPPPPAAAPTASK